MKVKYERKQRTSFGDLSWHDTFVLGEEGCEVVFMVIPQVKGSVNIPSDKYNAVCIGLQNRGANPLWAIDKDSLVYKVFITEITVVPEP